MTTKEQAKRIGQTATIVTKKEGLTVEVVISDYKFSYGNHRWLVKPVSGTGEAWVENVRFSD